MDDASGLAVPITLAWNSVSEQHALQVATDATFENLIIDATAQTRFYRIESLPAPGNYYWRVNASATWDGVRLTSDWSPGASFGASGEYRQARALLLLR